MEKTEREETQKKCRTFERSLGPFKIKLNPVVSVLSAMIIWGVVVWSIVQPGPAKAELSSWMLWVTKTWTWLYIGTQDVWAVFIIILYFSKYSDVKLGKPHEKPEYGDLTYFVMLFAAGVGIGLFYFGVAEPIWHYAPGYYGNRYWGRYVIHSSECKETFRNLTDHVYNTWGITGVLDLDLIWVWFLICGPVLCVSSRCCSPQL